MVWKQWAGQLREDSGDGFIDLSAHATERRGDQDSSGEELVPWLSGTECWLTQARPSKARDISRYRYVSERCACFPPLARV